MCIAKLTKTFHYEFTQGWISVMHRQAWVFQDPNWISDHISYIERSREVSKPWNSYSNLSHCFEIWLAPVVREMLQEDLLSDILIYPRTHQLQMLVYAWLLLRLLKRKLKKHWHSLAFQFNFGWRLNEKGPNRLGSLTIVWISVKSYLTMAFKRPLPSPPQMPYVYVGVVF